ncbi:hypothetical protein [Streptomyces sp. NPDC015131]|uniref:hypothetical protein n=1 Tax=Streptomyces sp. NPDC015131 TaxID=3364941 RepID=UPI0036FDE074
MDVARIVVLILAVAFGVVSYRRFMGGGSGETKSARRAQELGFLPESRQNTRSAAPEPHVERVTAAAARGRWEGAAEMLAETRANRDWERRSHLADRFGSQEAARPGSWLDAWEAAAGPDDPDVALVRARATVALAWHLRGAQYAKHTSAEQFAGFFTTLRQAPGLNARAAELAPDDPSPYVSEIWAAVGLNYSHDEMERIWKEITARAPYHYGAHRAALQYWCAKWHGSAELATGFARDAAAAAPPGTLLTALPLIAWYEHHDSDAKAADFRSPDVTALVDAALMDVSAAPPGHPHVAGLRHILAYFLTRQCRYDAAVEQFRLVDGHVGALPWYYLGEEEAYCRWRDRAIRGAGL